MLNIIPGIPGMMNFNNSHDKPIINNANAGLP